MIKLSADFDLKLQQEQDAIYNRTGRGGPSSQEPESEGLGDPAAAQPAPLGVEGSDNGKDYGSTTTTLKLLLLAIARMDGSCPSWHLHSSHVSDWCCNRLGAYACLAEGLALNIILHTWARVL